MAFCANCGATLTQQSGFCGSCGKPIGGAVAATASPSGGTGTAAAMAPSTGMTSNVAGALAYILGFITGIIFLVIEPYKNDRFVRFHAMQSIIYSAACIVFSIAWGIVWSILFSVSGSLALLAIPIRLLISLGMFLYWLYLMYQAYSQKEYRIPVLGAFAAKQMG
jgi:uncharacterized membrane protein